MNLEGLLEDLQTATALLMYLVLNVGFLVLVYFVYLVLRYLMLMYLVLDQNFGALGVLGAPEKEGRLLGVGNIDQSRRADRVLLSIFLRPLLS